MAERIRLFEVGPRDGLQNEKRVVPLATKLRFVQDLIKAGVRDLELGAFVRPDRVPQMADTDAVYAAVRSRKLKLGAARAWALVPNRKGFERAIAAGAKRIAVFTAATDGFTKHNIGMTVKESLAEFGAVIQAARKERIHVRGYVSTAFGCPYEGKVPARKALKVIEALADLGVDQVSIGDTIGVATPAGVEAVVAPALLMLGEARTAVHFHDTRGTALANALRAFELGVRIFDASAGGLGGCPYAPGASGNLATEDLVYMFDGMGVKTGIDLALLARASLRLLGRMKRPAPGKFVQAFASSLERF